MFPQRYMGLLYTSEQMDIFYLQVLSVISMFSDRGRKGRIFSIAQLLS